MPLGKWKLLAAGIALVAAFSAGLKVAGWRHDAALKDALEMQAEEFRHRLAAAAVKAEDEQRRAAEFSRDLTRIRRERDMALDELDARPTLTRTITQVLRDDCPVCNCPALGADFRVLYNAAADTDRDPAAPPAGRGDAAVSGSLPAAR